jgi:AcrR family transcriptional regulator
MRSVPMAWNTSVRCSRYDGGVAGTTAVQGDRALRSDAQRRRQAILCAASAVFVADGLEAPLDAVARQAGVGIATLYRRFPTRDALIEAVFEAKMDRYAQVAEQAAARAPAEPWAAFADYVRAIADMQLADPAFGSALLRPGQGSPLFADAHARALRATRLLVLRARRAGAILPDVRESDLYLHAAATAALADEPGPVPAERAVRRATELFLRAVRAPAR